MMVCIVKAYLVIREDFGGCFYSLKALLTKGLSVNSQKPRLLSSPEISGLSKTGLIFSDHNVKISSTERDL